MAGRLLILSNCTHVGLARYAAALQAFESVTSHAIYEGDEAGRNAIHERLHEYDLILTIFHGAAWGSLATERLKQRFGDRTLSFPSIYFPALQPDCCLLVDRAGKPFPYIGSAGLLRMHQHGVGPEAALRRLQRGELPLFIEPRAYWDRSLDALRSRDAVCDIAIADIIEEECRLRPSMFTFNHHDMRILKRVVDAALILWGVAAPPRAAAEIRHDLEDHTIWPVYDFVAEALDLPYRTPQRFLTGRGRRREKSFGDYVTMMFQIYDIAGSRNLRVSTPLALAAVANKQF